MAKGKIFEGLPKWAQGVIAVAVVAGVGVVAFNLYKKYKGMGEKKDAKLVTNENLTEFDKLKNQGQKLSKPIPAYQQLINDIVKKLNGCEDIRTELQVIEGIIKVVKKPIDWYYLVSKFGNRDIEDCGTFGFGKTNYDLPTLLKDQLDTAGAYSINVDGFKSSGFTSNTINVLKEYFSKIGVVI